MRNPRRGYNSDGAMRQPKDLANMRANGVRAVLAECQACRREAAVDCDAMPERLPVPDVALRLVCGVCGSKRILTRPNWAERAS